MDSVIQVDENDNNIKKISRADAHKHGLLHRIAVVYLFNRKGEILVQERMDYGAYDHSAAGHVDPGETYDEAIARELKEELGVENVELHEVGITKSEEFQAGRNKHIRHILKIFECIADPVILNKDEVRRVFWDDPLRVYKAMQNDPMNQVYTGGFKDSLRYILKKKRLL